jgi:hypothetical protein
MSTLKVNTIQSNTTSELDINSPLGTVPSLDVINSVTVGGNINVGTGASISSPATNLLALGTNNTEAIRINSSGLVGIGSDSPTAPLNVVNNNANTPTVWLRNISGGGDAPVLRVQGGANNNNTVGTFEVRDYDGNVDFKVGGTGNIGIGTNNPTSKLQVQGTIGLGASDDLESGFPGGRTKLTSSASGFVINHNDNSATIFQNQGVERVRIKSDGKTGINNTNPLSTLSVGTRTSDVSDSSLIFTAGGSSSGGEVLAATFCNTAAGASNNATAISFTCRSGDSQTAKIVAMQPSGASSPNTQLDFYVYNNSGLTKIVTFDQNGRVTTPYQPRAHIRKTGGSTLTTTPAVIPFETETYDAANNFSSNRFTAPISGYYLVTVNVNILATTNNVSVEIRLNGSLYAGMNYTLSAANIRTNYAMSGVVYAAASDYIEIYGYVNTSTVGVDNAGHLSIALLG